MIGTIEASFTAEWEALKGHPKGCTKSLKGRRGISEGYSTGVLGDTEASAAS
ncbi:hypothetical protein PF005_g29802 [Phytophthora fragariae]|uniref:Uncharacterized protein n=1 Tax=Phytophthora fragariae TaxID=53985 RepID=A0A6A4B8T1_9STRA|nr:hypothetical protein PF003_g28350 [Phytophthora fragariae]KAE8919965.1 hypothetical protein PF009_g29734 [Phytophthora fragariae]KAE9057456.1 hypothetical protein PF007_g31641 [Phytophthora fragariae]KAE9062350.1 hypothetical protein PF010_g29439 [Phytophthora fragariae]KAE9069710.1 hypothetical protein PF006_g29514 [Phytophthora fragariae]